MAPTRGFPKAPSGPTALLFSLDTVAVYMCVVFFGAPIVTGWHWTLLFSAFCAVLNVTPRTLLGSASYSRDSRPRRPRLGHRHGYPQQRKGGNSGVEGYFTSDSEAAEALFESEFSLSETEDGSGMGQLHATTPILASTGGGGGSSAPAAAAAAVPGDDDSALLLSDLLFDLDRLAAALIDDGRYYCRLPNRLHKNISFRVALFSAAAAGAIVTPLDAENWWQFWPMPSFVMSIVVAVVAMLAPRRFFLTPRQHLRAQQRVRQQQQQQPQQQTSLFVGNARASGDASCAKDNLLTGEGGASAGAMAPRRGGGDRLVL